MRGTAPAGRTLRITRTLSYRTSAKPDDDDLLYPQQTIAEPRNTTLVVGAGGRFSWAVNPSTQPNAATSAWTLTCEDGAGTVLESRQVFVARGETVQLALACGAAVVPAAPPPLASCARPAAFARVAVARRSRGRLRIAFARNPGAARVTVEVRRNSRRVVRFGDRSRSFTWSGRRRGRKVANGVYVVRFTAKDAAGRTDARRVVVRKQGGKFARRGSLGPVRGC